MHDLAFIYKTLYPSHQDTDFSNFQNFVQLYYSKMEKNKSVFDMSVLPKFQNNPTFIEDQLLKLILELNNISIEPEYLNLFINKMSVESIIGDDKGSILVDELFTYTIRSFFFTVYSLANDDSIENFERCFKNFIVTLDLQGRRKIIGTHDKSDFNEMMCMPLNILNLACDSYWCVWTFIIGHEFYHLIHKDDKHTLEDEINADHFGYNILIKMIGLQNENRIPKELQVFSESQYLSPVIFLEYFRLLDEYKTLCDPKSKETSAFSPGLRKKLIIETYYDEIPETFNTEEGNDLLNNILDVIDKLEEQLIIKFNNLTLDFIINNKK